MKAKKLLCAFLLLALLPFYVMLAVVFDSSGTKGDVIADANQAFTVSVTDGVVNNGEALQITVRREAKSKGDKERYKHRNAEFQRIARRDKKAFSETTYFELKTTLGAEYRERQGN